MVLLWYHSEEPFSVTDGTFMFLCVEYDLNINIIPFFYASYVEFGPMFKTTDPDKMKTEISKLTARGGGDYPEMCLSGLQVPSSLLDLGGC